MLKVVRKIGEKAREKQYRIAAAAFAATAPVIAPASAFAASDANSILSTVMGYVQRGVALLGGFLIVWGAVKLGLAIKDQQGGNAIAESLGFIAGGAVIIAAAAFFTTLTF